MHNHDEIISLLYEFLLENNFNYDFFLGFFGRGIIDRLILSLSIIQGRSCTFSCNLPV